MAAYFSNRWRKPVAVDVLIDEVQNLLLTFGKHDFSYTVQMYGSQAGIQLAWNVSQTYRGPMTSQRGVALILALMVLAFLTVLGGALLTTSMIDIRISDNYKTGVQSLYLAEAGIDQARELLRASASSPTQLLTAAAGRDGVISVTRDLASLLASDDQPLIPSTPSLRTPGQALTDESGQIIGRYHVWLRNDNADGMTSPVDRNQVLTLVSIGRIGNAQKVLEVTIRKAGFAFDDPALQTVPGLEDLVARITANATDVYHPVPGIPEVISNYGSANNYRVAVVDGDVNLGAGVGYGILLARGDVAVIGNFTWNGLILVIGRGTFHWNDADGLVNGGLFVARTRAADGTLLTEPADVTVNINGDTSTIAAANGSFPYVPIAIRER